MQVKRLPDQPPQPLPQPQGQGLTQAQGPGAGQGQSPAQALPKTDAPPGPRPVQDAGVSAMQRLMKVEGEVRRTQSIAELVFLAANETRKIINARQLFVLRIVEPTKVKVEGVSSLTTVDRNTPAVIWVERLLTRMAADTSLEKPRTFRLPAYTDPNDTYDGKTYPFPEMKWTPLLARDGTPFAGLLLARETPWGESDDVVAMRLAEAYAHAWQALEPRTAWQPRKLFSLKLKIAAAAALGLAMFYPVSMTVLAPAEIAASEAFVVAAPIDGVIEDIAVEPNSSVAAGATLVRFTDTQARNALVVAEREVGVAEAKLRQVTQQAFTDPDAKREFASARADVAVKQAERDYARDVLAKTTIAAPRPGIAVFADKRDLIGRPVTVGQRILEIADPNRVEVRIDVPVSDAIGFETGSHVRMFLDSDPLHPVEAVVARASHSARPKENNVLAFRVDAKIVETAETALPRLGLRGTAQIQGPRVMLFYYLFRRPITYLRQRFGL